MNNKTDDVLNFDFQEIELSEIPKLLPTQYRSKYSEFGAQLAARIDTMAGHKSFMFAPAAGAKMQQNQINNLCSTVSRYFLKNEKANWKIRYSNIAKAFVVAPVDIKKRKAYYKRRVLEARPPDKESKSRAAGRSKDTLDFLTTSAYKLYGFTLQDLSQKFHGGRRTNPEHNVIMNLKAAIAYVGRNSLRLSIVAIAEHLSMRDASLHYLKQTRGNNPETQAMIKTLTAAVTKAAK